MPLNPNGKIDKPALPFPDTALAPPPPSKSLKLSPTQKTIYDIWLKLLPVPPASLDTEDNFFDLGGHSILATRLIFELRKTFVIDIPLGLVFERPTIGGLAEKIDSLRNEDLGLQQGPENGTQTSAIEMDYAKDVDVLLPTLPATFAPLPAEFPSKKLTVFLTGATGFLGAFILNDLLAKRSDRVAKVICLVRAKSKEDALNRLRESGQGRGVWEQDWETQGRVEAVVGDLADENFGLDAAEWSRIAREADAVLHNGAIVSAFPRINLQTLIIFCRYTGYTHTPSCGRQMLSRQSPPSSSALKTIPRHSPSCLPPRPWKPSITLSSRISLSNTVARVCPKQTTWKEAEPPLLPDMARASGSQKS
jgi:L-aminoadipate-semialdehyde dehydrogenase